MDSEGHKYPFFFEKKILWGLVNKFTAERVTKIAHSIMNSYNQQLIIFIKFGDAQYIHYAQ